MSNQPTPPQAVKPGWQTTEFWQTLILQGISLAVVLRVISPSESSGLGSALTHAVESIFALIVAGGTVVNYISNRTRLKSGG